MKSRSSVFPQTNRPGSRPVKSIPAWFDAVFNADLRSLAAFRIVMAIIVLIDLAGKASNLTVFYTDEGVLPRRTLLAGLRPWAISLNLVGGTFLVEALLFGFTFAVALCLLVGYRSRIASILVWAMVLSIQWRNPYVLHAADELLRVLLFWGMFLPLGAVWSVDRLRRTNPIRISTRFVSIGVAGLFLQIAFMYWFAVILKSGREWRIEGTALSYALSNGHLASPTGTFFLQFPGLLKILTFGTLVVEAFAPLLLLSPFLKGPLRTMGVALVMSLHLGILVTMNIGYFPLLSAFCVVCYLPAWFWDSVVPRLRHALPAHARLEALIERAHSVPERLHTGAIPDWFTRIRRTGASMFTVGDAGHSQGVGNVGPASSRARLEERADAMAGSREMALRVSPASNVLAAIFLVYVFVLNITTVTDYSMPLPAYSRPLAVASGLDQRWAMYSPRPAQVTYWFTVPGVLKDGTQVNLLPAAAEQDPDKAGAVSGERPSNVNETYRDMYWLRYLSTLIRPNSQERLLQFGGYICRSWNEWYPEGPMQLQTFDIIYFIEPTLPDGTRGEIQQRILWQHRCR